MRAMIKEEQCWDKNSMLDIMDGIGNYNVI